MPLAIRPARPIDKADLFRICVLTADNGGDGTALYSDPHYPGLVWAVPYLEFAPEHAFVLADDDAVLGYIVGTSNTSAFEDRLALDWWPLLRQQYEERSPTAPSDPAVLDRIASTPRSDPAIAASHPAHLHINLLPPAQSGGWGRKLIETELDSLNRAGASAVHLGVSPNNSRAMGFYRHLGFTELGRDGGVVLGKVL